MSLNTTRLKLKCFPLDSDELEPPTADEHPQGEK